MSGGDVKDSGSGKVDKRGFILVVAILALMLVGGAIWFISERQGSSELDLAYDRLAEAGEVALDPRGNLGQLVNWCDAASVIERLSRAEGEALREAASIAIRMCREVDVPTMSEFRDMSRSEREAEGRRIGIGVGPSPN